MRLTELEPQFVRYRTALCLSTGQTTEYFDHVDSLAKAQGIQFLCPVCWVKNRGPIGTHGIEVSFTNRGVKDHQGSHNKEGKPSRWQPSGTGYADLTTKPSILIDPALPACKGWHGFITDGVVST